jgi:hypothetical protein
MQRIPFTITGASRDNLRCVKMPAPIIRFYIIKPKGHPYRLDKRSGTILRADDVHGEETPKLGKLRREG